MQNFFIIIYLNNIANKCINLLKCNEYLIQYNNKFLSSILKKMNVNISYYCRLSQLKRQLVEGISIIITISNNTC